MWGEHEIDYVLCIQKDVMLQRNKNEVKDYRYVSKQQLQQLIGLYYLFSLSITPFQRLIQTLQAGLHVRTIELYHKINGIDVQ